MPSFQEDLQAYKNVTQPVATISAQPQQIGQTPIVDRSTFEQDLENFRANQPRSADFGGIAQEVANRAQMAAQELEQKQYEASLVDQERLDELAKYNASNERVSSEEPIMSQEMYGSQETVLPEGVQVTQKFGNRNPGVEVFSKGINYGTDFSTKRGTPVAIPPGEWEVVDSWGGARRAGFIGNGDNSGYGNSVLIRNTKTGELMRYSHLDVGSVRAQKGQTLKGGTIFAKTGNTGNSTGPHLDLEYINPNGKYADVLDSPYAGSLFAGQGGGNPIKAIGEFVKGIKDKMANKAKEDYRVMEQYGPRASIGAVMNKEEPLMSRVHKYLEKEQLPGQVLTGALADRAMKNPDYLLAQKAYSDQPLSATEVKRLESTSLAPIMGITGGLSAATNAELANTLKAIRSGLGSRIPTKQMTAIENLGVAAKDYLGKPAVKEIGRRNVEGNARIDALLAELEGLLQQEKPRVRIENL